MERSRRLKHLLAAAAVEEHFRKKESSQRLRAMLDSVSPPILVPFQDARNRTISCCEDDRTLRERRLRFRAMLLRRAYSLAAHLPLTAVLNLRRVDVDTDGKFVLLTLTNGTRLLDTGDRVTVRGRPDAVALEELVACCARRSWQRVEVDGDIEFRIAASRELVRQGIAVVDCPLSAEEQAELRKEAEGIGFDWKAIDEQPAYRPVPPWVA